MAEEIRPFWLDPNERLCPGGCEKVISRERRSCGRRWCDAVRPTWGRAVGQVIGAALDAYVGLWRRRPGTDHGSYLPARRGLVGYGALRASRGRVEVQRPGGVPGEARD